MKLHKLSCPNCNGILDLNVDNRAYIFCPYCGQKFFIEDGKKEYTINQNINIKKDININKNVTHTHRTYDEAEIIKERASLTKEKMGWIFAICCFVFGFLMLGIMHLSGNLSVKKEEARLQGLVEEIMIDIENENYDAAEIKANQLYWESDWTSDPAEKWDATRETIMKQIKEAQGIDTSEPEEEESKGLFGWFK